MVAFGTNHDTTGRGAAMVTPPYIEARILRVFRRANLTHLEGGSASKIDPLNLFLLDCPFFVKAGGGDADCGDDWANTAGSFGQGKVDPGDRPRPEAISQHDSAGSAIG